MMKVRLVNVSDVEEAMRMRLRDWRNSAEVSPFFLLDQVTEEQHRAWLERNIRGLDARACVIYANEVPLGLVYLPWFDRKSHCGEIGIYIYNKKFRDLRPATVAYVTLMKQAEQELGLKQLYARILEGNIASVRFHERMGFVRIPDEDIECEKAGKRRRVLMYSKTL